MSTTAGTAPTPQVGDHVVLRGTRIVGDVTRVEDGDGQGRVSVKVTAVIGKADGSKAARAWRGAWITCTPALVSPQLPSPN
jgi:hypothetical protein